MNKIVINGNTHHISGNNVTIKNGKVIVDGKVIEDGLSGDVHVKWEGDLAKLECNTAEIVGDVHGDVKTNTLKCMSIGGNANGNSIKAGIIKGNVKGNSIKGV